jgi:hypothetical protein
MDFFDPNTWEPNTHEYRIYGDDYANEYALVDEIDYHHLVQWRWKIKASRGGRKHYLARSYTTIIGEDYKDETGKRKQQRITSTLFLHTEVMERTGIPRPNTNEKLVVDHANGDGFDCRRKNLRWATLTFNNRNRFGSHEKTLFEDVA